MSIKKLVRIDSDVYYFLKNNGDWNSKTINKMISDYYQETRISLLDIIIDRYDYLLESGVLDELSDEELNELHLQVKEDINLLENIFNNNKHKPKIRKTLYLNTNLSSDEVNKIFNC